MNLMSYLDYCSYTLFEPIVIENVVCMHQTNNCGDHRGQEDAKDLNLLRPTESDFVDQLTWNYYLSRLNDNLEQQRGREMKPLVGILTRLIISETVVKVLLGLSSRMKKWEICC